MRWVNTSKYNCPLRESDQLEKAPGQMRSDRLRIDTNFELFSLGKKNCPRELGTVIQYLHKERADAPEFTPYPDVRRHRVLHVIKTTLSRLALLQNFLQPISSLTCFRQFYNVIIFIVVVVAVIIDIVNFIVVSISKLHQWHHHHVVDSMWNTALFTAPPPPKRFDLLSVPVPHSP